MSSTHNHTLTTPTLPLPPQQPKWPLCGQTHPTRHPTRVQMAQTHRPNNLTTPSTCDPSGTTTRTRTRMVMTTQAQQQQQQQGDIPPTPHTSITHTPLCPLNGPPPLSTNNPRAIPPTQIPPSPPHSQPLHRITHALTTPPIA
ncbi:hypothetical protein PAXINDRAFT_16275 [Paxillus involutus ATCC 200175]|uniref:Uncharacterized protein n=1 Tax=Paxillus involutus ATCC 200175 TaxID=664439 RepID=A0A0C9TJ35_PAXIN|nr:hypothetical protein PAXINDRAFT_16275 [Paxillus involutus ATCC 200175]